MESTNNTYQNYVFKVISLEDDPMMFAYYKKREDLNDLVYKSFGCKFSGFGGGYFQRYCVNDVLIIVESNDIIIGMSLVQFDIDEYQTSYLSCVCVDLNFQREGIASEMLRIIVNHISNNTNMVLCVDNNESKKTLLIPFYQKYGFQQTKDSKEEIQFCRFSSDLSKSNEEYKKYIVKNIIKPCNGEYCTICEFNGDYENSKNEGIRSSLEPEQYMKINQICLSHLQSSLFDLFLECAAKCTKCTESSMCGFCSENRHNDCYFKPLPGCKLCAQEENFEREFEEEENFEREFEEEGEF
jgi:ribosomal protein S18 acetylase RimI-like enzyme